MDLFNDEAFKKDIAEYSSEILLNLFASLSCLSELDEKEITFTKIFGYMLGIKVFSSFLEKLDADLNPFKAQMGISPEKWELAIIELRKEIISKLDLPWKD